MRAFVRPRKSPLTPLASRLLLSTILASGIAAPALAQTAPAPEPYRNNDENGVDLVTGTYNLEMVEGDIGPAGNGGVRMVRYYGQSGNRDNWSGDLRRTASGITITFGKISESFTKQGSVWVPAKANGATLTETVADTEFVYRSAEGKTITYKSPLALNDPSPDFTPTISMPGGYCTASNALACGVPVESTDPDGSKYTLTWQTPEQCVVDAELNSDCTRTYRLSDVRSSSSYGMKVKYQSDQNFTGSPGNQGPPPSGWFIRSGLRFLDLSQAYCDPNANNCDAVPGTWPTVTYSTPSAGVVQITNDVAGTWRLDGSVANQFRVRRPGQTSDTTIATYSGTRVSSITNNGQTTNYNWTTGATTTVTATTGGGETQTVVSTPAVGQPSTETNGTSNSTTNLYDANNRITRETRPEGDYTNITYDARGNVTEVRNVAKAGSGLADIVTTANFDASCTNAAKCNKPNYAIDAKGNRTDYTYDATTGELTRVQLPAATSGGTRPEVNYVYSMLSAQIKDAGGTLYAQPAQAKLTQVTSCSTAATCAGTANETKITIAYNTPNLLPTSVTTAAGDGSISSTVAYAYDARDNLTSVDGPLPGTDDTTTYIYDTQDRRRGVIGPDPDGAGARPRAAERYTFNTESRVTKAETGTVSAATEAALNAMTVAQTIDYLYDVNGNLVRETVSGTAGAHQITQMTYNVDNRLSCTAVRMNPAVFASLSASACTMGTAGTGANDFGADRIVQNSYDAAGRVTLVKTAFGATEQANEVTTAFTPNGQTSYVVDAENNRTTYTYDGHDRVSQTRYPSATKGANSSNTADYEQLTYDANSNVTQRRLRDGQLINFTYDNLDRIILKDVPNLVAGEFDVTYSYDLLGRLTSMTNASSVPTSFTYDALNRTKTESTNSLTKTMTYDAASHLTSLAYPGGTLTVNYDYDVTNQVTAIRENGATSGIGVLAAYTYDSLGRRSSVTYGNGVVQSYAFNTNQRLSTLTSNLAGTANDQTATLGYNPAGQLDTLSKSNDSYAWNGHYNVDRVSAANGLNQLTVTTPGAGQTSVATLGYDARGNLTTSGSSSYSYTSENRLATGPSSLAMRYDLGGRLWQVVQGAATTRFDYAGSALLAETDGAGTVLRRYVHGPGVDEPIVQYEGSGLTNRRFFTSDERGSVIAVTDNAGTALALNRYDEYGIPQSTNASLANGGRFSYTGQTWLPELGMYYYKARIYSPTLGRFMQSDPIGYGDGMNFYNYVGSDPVNGVDPTGTSCTITTYANFRNYWNDEEQAYGGWVRVANTTEKTGDCESLGLGSGQNPAEEILVLASQLDATCPVITNQQVQFLADQMQFVLILQKSLKVDPTLLLGLSAHESGWGRSKAYRERSNPFGATPGGDATAGLTYKNFGYAWADWSRSWGARVYKVGPDENAFIKNLLIDNRDNPNGVDQRGAYNPMVAPAGDPNWNKNVLGAISAVRNRIAALQNDCPVGE